MPSLINQLKHQIDRTHLQAAVAPLASLLARSQRHGVARIFYDNGVWIHQTSRGYFAYHQPYLRLDLTHLDAVARHNFFWGYRPRHGDTILDVGAGVGEETLTFSRAIGKAGRLVCVEAHPRTFRCLEKLVHYNHLENVTALPQAVVQPACASATIADSDDYLANHLQPDSGIMVAATTLDTIHRSLGLGRIDFLKMNIEGAERLAIQGMTETLRHTAVLCVSCHDFLADAANDQTLRTKSTVEQFLLDHGFHTASRSGPNLAQYLRDQIWAFNPQLGAKGMS
jgi:FkbM family methyltransferase